MAMVRHKKRFESATFSRLSDLSRLNANIRDKNRHTVFHYTSPAFAVVKDIIIDAG
jgi:hypothetical protein